MSADHAFLEPEVDALLREAASDPRSILLRVERKRAVPLLFSDESDVGPMTSGFASIDRHLLAVHRSEVAELLRRVCLMRLLEGPRGRVCVSRHTTASIEVKVPRIADLRRHAHSERQSHVRSELEATGLDLVFRAIREPMCEEPTVSELAAVSYRLHPTNEARIFAAMDLSQRDSPRSALQLLVRVLQSHPSRDIAASACDNMGFAWNELGNLGAAAAAVKQSMTYSQERVTTCMNGLAFGIQLGDERSILEADRRLRELISPQHPAVDFFISSAIAAWSQHRWSPTDAAAPVVRSVRRQLGEAATRVAEVFFATSMKRVGPRRELLQRVLSPDDRPSASGPATQGLVRGMNRYAQAVP